MKQFLLLATLLLSMCISISYAQLDHLAVQGSSTALGYGVPEDSSFAGRLKRYYMAMGRIDTVHKIAALSLTCYAGMPTGYIPPAGRPSPDLTFNINRTLSRNPKPTILIINYPSNGYDYMSVQEVLFCLQTIKETAEGQGIRCFVTTTHPRDGFSPAERLKLRVMRDSIMLRFGNAAIDFWTPLVNAATNTIKTEYSLGDGVHINSQGHQAIFEQVVAKNIFATTVQTPTISLGNDITRSFTSPSVSLNVPIDIQRLQKGTYTLTVKLLDSLGVEYKDTSMIFITAPANVAPTANAGADRILTLPLNSLTLQGSGTDTDGSITSWLWTQVSGPNTGLIGSSNQPSTLISNLIQGIYQFQLTVSDNNGAMATDIVQVTVNPAPPPPNILPTVNAGNDQAIQLPVNTVNLSGTANDTDGTIATYLWSRVSGPTTFTLVSPNLPQTELRDLVTGTYMFKFQATDNAGGISADSVIITVTSANPPPVNILPVVNAGVNQTIQLPVNSVTLIGTATDSDGTIASYLWSRVSGPATFTLVSPGLAQTELRDLIAGTYVFSLQATDNGGGAGTDTVVITVTDANPPPVNILPVVNAGVNQTIQLPVNSVTLIGTATDSDGTIASYLWSRVSGPTTFTLVSPGLAQTELRDLIAGTYIFKLQATDNVGGTGADSVIITVATANLPPPVTGNQRVLVDLGMTTTTTNSPDQWGKYWNNMTDARVGLRLNNAVTIENVATTIKIDVVRPTGSNASYDNNMRTGDGVLAIGGQYPASATNDHAFAHTSITNGQWRIYGLDPNRTYTIKFWGSRNSSGSRFMQIKRADETVWKEYNASLNTNYDSAAKFIFTGKVEMYFDIRVRSGSTFSYINVLDISSVSNTVAALRSNTSTEIATLKTVDIQVNPNPGSGRFSFRGSSDYDGQIRFFVRSNGGELLIQGVANKSEVDFNGSIDLTKYAAGPYFLTVVEGTNTRTVTLIKE